MKKVNFGYNLLLLLTAMIWGFAFVAQVEGCEHLGPLSMNGVRFTLGTVSLIPVVLFFERGRREKEERKKTVIYSVITGGVLFSASTLQQFGLSITGSAGVSGFITALYTIFIPVACMVFFKAKVKGNVWIGAVSAVLGLFLLCYVPGQGFTFGVGELLLFIGSFFWTAHVILVDRLGKNIRSLHFAWGQFATCSVLSLAAMFIFEEPTLKGIYDARIAILYCGLMSVGVAYTLQVIAQKKADPTFAAIAFSAESVFSAIGGALFGVDNISLIGYVGCGFICFGIVIAQLTFERKNKKISHPADKEAQGG